MIFSRDFGAVGDGITDDTQAIQAWASQTDERVLSNGVYLVSKPIVFAAGGGVTGQGNALKVSDDFVGYSLIVGNGTAINWLMFRDFKINLNNKDVWLASEKESNFIHFGSNIIVNSKKYIEFKAAFEHEVEI